MCECVTGMYLSYKTCIIQLIEVKFIRVKEICNLHLYTKFRSSILSRLGEMRIESCQNVSALPADKPISITVAQIEKQRCGSGWTPKKYTRVKRLQKTGH